MNSDFLDTKQYTPKGIKDYESVWGEGFVSPGGGIMARKLVEQLQLARNSLVLDVGCGLGGSAFVMAQEFGYRVHGIDLSQNMVEAGRKLCEQRGLEGQVSLRFGDCLEIAESDQYDAVYSRDAFLHIHRKSELFHTLHRALKPGGHLLFTDYCCGEKPWSLDFSRYVEEREYALHTLPEYRALVEQAGFQHLESTDLTAEFLDTLRADLERLRECGQREELLESWRAKIRRAESGEQRWGLLKAAKV